jgi:hypothetical protein
MDLTFGSVPLAGEVTLARIHTSAVAGRVLMPMF